MAKGKFSNPRPYREEEREIEYAFQQVSAQDGGTDCKVYTPGNRDATMRMPDLNMESEETASAEPDISQEFFADFSGDPTPAEGAFLREPEQEPAPAQPSFWDRVLTFTQKNKKAVLVGTCALALVLIMGFIAVLLLSTVADPYNGKILNNVVVAGVNVGGLTKSEAVKVVTQTVGDSYSEKSMTVRLGGTTLNLDPADTKAKLNVKAAVNAAYDYGRTGTKEEKQEAYNASFTGNHTIGLLPYLNLNEDFIRGELEDYSQSVGSVLTQTAYALEGTVPDLTADTFDPQTSQKLTLVITMGTPGVDFQVEDLMSRILDAYSLGSFQVTWENTDPNAEPAEPDWEQVRAELCKEPVNATMDMQTYQVIPGSYGYDFDPVKAQQLVDQAQYGQIIRLEMEYVAPEILGEDMFFRDVLATCKTPHSKNANRTTNLQLACKALDGLILNPGETFSYNDTLGERTSAKGYKLAPSYSGDELVDSIGGGICQVSSTLYCATLMADLETVQRSSHGLPVSYIDYGMDATVNWGGPDLKFRNSTNYPIQLSARVSDGYVIVEILGTDEKDYYIEMSYTITATYSPETQYVDYGPDNEEGYKDGDVIQKGSKGYAVKTYKNKYSKENGALLTKEYVTSSQYKSVNKLVARVESKETVEPTTEPTTEATTEPTTETTEPETSDPEENKGDSNTGNQGGEENNGTGNEGGSGSGGSGGGDGAQPGTGGGGSSQGGAQGGQSGEQGGGTDDPSKGDDQNLEGNGAA